MLKRVQRCAGLGGGTRRFHQFPLTRVSAWERNRIDWQLIDKWSCPAQARLTQENKVRAANDNAPEMRLAA